MRSNSGVSSSLIFYSPYVNEHSLYKNLYSIPVINKDTTAVFEFKYHATEGILEDLLVWWSRFEWGGGCCFSFPNCFWVHLRRSWPRYWSYLCSISITCSRTRSLEVCYKTLSIAYHVCSLSAALRLVSITHSNTRMLHLISIRPPTH